MKRITLLVIGILFNFYSFAQVETETKQFVEKLFYDIPLNVSVISGHNHLKRISGNDEVKTYSEESFYCYVHYTKKNPYFFTPKFTNPGYPKLILQYKDNKLLLRRLNIYGQTSNSNYEKLTLLLKSISDHIEIEDDKSTLYMEKEDVWHKHNVRIFYYLTETSKEHFAEIYKVDCKSFFDIYIFIWDEKLKM